jgi:hypothetical protein
MHMMESYGRAVLRTTDVAIRSTVVAITTVASHNPLCTVRRTSK